ncbi:hypothetical protein [Yoonia vestfoldensis]|uniref:hypothetical protein n=1 Tax=Yoonia vestfoldensis TaxID=245188 RepID=UPI0012FFCAF3|nr:hypothetical protein [Yoonia vestfoldensis]
MLLIAGRHRLAAAIKLKWESIDALQMPAVDGDDGREADGRLTEIAENLHRREISHIERAGLVAEWVRITGERISGQVGHKIGRGRPGTDHDRWETGASCASFRRSGRQ